MLSWTILCYPEQSCTILRNPVLSRAFLCNPPSAILCYSEQCCTILPEQSCDIGIYQPFFIKKTKCIEARHKIFEPFWGSNIKILRTSEPQGKNTCLENKLLFYQLCYQHVGKNLYPQKPFVYCQAQAKPYLQLSLRLGFIIACLPLPTAGENVCTMYPLKAIFSSWLSSDSACFK